MTDSRSKLQMMIVTALFAAIIGVMAQLTIPLPLVPITGQTLAIGLAATILGSRYGTISVLVYLAMGAVGIPVFSGMSAGLGVVFGPTGGFLVGFIPATFIMGYYMERTSFSFGQAMIANVIGMFITLFFGTVWLKFIAELSWTAAFMAGFVPFLIGGFIKAFLAAWAGLLIRGRLMANRLLLA